RRTFLTAAGTGAAALSLGAVTAPATAAAPADPRLLKHWFDDTYRSIEAMTTDFGLVTDKIDLRGAGAPAQSPQTSPTNIGCGLWSTVAAAGLG
ncbi:hypothetical protein B5180_38880, partial [Streptomyces sp. BF-3]